MANATEINPARFGLAGKKVVVGEVTLSSGTVDVSTVSLTVPQWVFITEKGTTTGEKFSWVVAAGNGNFTIDSNNASSSATVSYLAIGY